MGSEHYCLRWNNHQSNLLGVFSQLLRDESLVDVTLACSEGHSIRAHKVVLSACSSYFQTLFVDHPSRHPIVILKDVRFAELRTLIEFMYKGEVNVEYCQLSALLKTAESLKVKGLAEMTREYKHTEPEQTEPTELTRRPASHSPSVDENDRLHPSSQSPPVQNLRVCRSPIDHQENEAKRPSSPENTRNVSSPVTSDCGPSDMSIHSNSNNMVAACPGMNAPIICTRLPSPITEPLPGPSNMPPVQQVPLSLKKEVDWSGGLEDKNTGESSSDFSRHPHDSTSVDIDRPSSSPHERPSSTQSSRSSTPFALPFPSLPTSILEVGLIHPSLLGEEMFRCPSCMAAFPSIWLLEQHTALQHIGSLNSLEKPFICEQCGQSYRYRSAYVKHREQNHRARLPADKLFSCDVCGMQFRYLKSFKKHRLNHALEKLHGKSGDVGRVGAVEESKSVDNSSDQVSSSNETIVLEGKDEGVVVKKEESMNDDAGEGASSDAEKPDADQDDTIDSMAVSYPVSSGTGLDILRSSHDPSIISFLRADAAEKQRERRFACPFCGKCVRSKENLKLHVRKHTGERPFVCLFCGRAFGGKSDLTRHLRIHTGERPYHCDMCGKCFARADYLSKHLTTHINTSR
ncbi:zinc finger protein 354A-like [Tribolium madens]|uniref:zinc finger protein 354A-like n=1 Tax=Tribolium madens TaxID=41895 RepID=UPI001CF72551|nr:zinc finger protein 354A-like [Tribolium madens]XP_044262730.1 zinc finger protein 354A-like [Tribolium madens]XP_044262731.1 zinc finger protein 354A-like [Tribolium madens]XP_044262732.1 zinc finger protein 354A-like [Tribolium madens]